MTPTPAPTVTATPSHNSQGSPFNYCTTCTPSPTVGPGPGQNEPTDLDTTYQPPSGDPQYGTTLQWVAYQPPSGGINGRWPVVVVLHIGGFHSGNYYESLQGAPQDLANAGFYTFVADYPLAPPGAIKGQLSHDTHPLSGRPPEQTRAVEAFISAAKADMHCYNGEVGVLGGSAGASHAAFIALDQTVTDGWPFWNATTARPAFVTCLSGQYDFAERDSDISNMIIKNFENYTNTTVPYDQWAVSPIAQIFTANQPTFKPMFFIRAENEMGSPATEQYYMWDALYRANDPTFYRMWTIPGNSEHAFGYWDDPILDTLPLQSGYKVKDRVIGYFKQYLPIP